MELFEHEINKIVNSIQGAWNDLDIEFRQGEADLDTKVQEILQMIEEGRVIVPKMPRIRTRQRKSHKFGKTVALKKGIRVSRRLSRKSMKKSVLPPTILEDPTDLQNASSSAPAEISSIRKKFFRSTKISRSYFEAIEENSPRMVSIRGESIMRNEMAGTVEVATELAEKVESAGENEIAGETEATPASELSKPAHIGNVKAAQIDSNESIRCAENESAGNIQTKPAHEVAEKVKNSNESDGKDKAVNELMENVEATNELNAKINATNESVKKVGAQTRKTAVSEKRNTAKESLKRTFQVHVENDNDEKDEGKTNDVLENNKTKSDIQDGTGNAEVDNKSEERRVTRARTKVIKRDKPSPNLPVIDGNGRETKAPLKDIKNAYIPSANKIGYGSALGNSIDKENANASHLFAKKVPRQEFGKKPWTPPTDISMGKVNAENTQLKKSSRSKKLTKEVPKPVPLVQNTLNVTNAAAYRDVKRADTPVSDPEDAVNSSAEEEIIIDATIDEPEPAASGYCIEDVGTCDETDYEDNPRKDIPTWALRKNRTDFLRPYKYLPSRLLSYWFKTPKLHTKKLGEALFQGKGCKVTKRP